MLWAPLIAGLSTLAGAELGKSERPTIDPMVLKSLFGPQALIGDTQSLYAGLLNSPEFASIMRSASLNGARIGNGIMSNAAASGAGASPIAGFAKSAARGYGTSLRLPMMSGLFEEALKAALENMSQRAGIWGQSQLGQQATPTFNRMIGSSLLGMGAQGFTDWMKGK